MMKWAKTELVIGQKNNKTDIHVMEREGERVWRNAVVCWFSQTLFHLSSFHFISLKEVCPLSLQIYEQGLRWQFVSFCAKKFFLSIQSMMMMMHPYKHTHGEIEKSLFTESGSAELLYWIASGYG
jgi:hypothetical protein